MISAAKSLVKAALIRPNFGGRVSSFLYRIGAMDLARRTAFYSGFTPENLLINVKGFPAESRTFRMQTANDLVAHVCWRSSYENYEAPLPIVYSSLVRSARVAVGVGANTGLYELMAAAVSDTARVYAFEPYPPAFEKLSQNIALNRYEKRVFPLKKALSDNVGTGDMYVPFERNFPDMVQTNVSIDPAFHSEVREKISVDVTTLDQFVIEHELRHIDVLRIDAEGAEDLVLAGAQAALHDFRPYVFVEVLEGRVNHMAIERIRISQKYECFSLETGAVVSRETLRPLGSSRNQLLCPHEKRLQCLELIKNIGLRVV